MALETQLHCGLQVAEYYLRHQVVYTKLFKYSNSLWFCRKMFGGSYNSRTGRYKFAINIPFFVIQKVICIVAQNNRRLHFGMEIFKIFGRLTHQLFRT